MPNALIEAVTMGVPSIATDCPVGGPKYIIHDREDGLLVSCNDVDAMTEAIKQLLCDRELREKISNNAHKNANRFYPENIGNMWERFIRSIQ